MNEADVVKSLYDSVKSGRFTGFSKEDLYIDYHPSLTKIFSGRDVQRFTLPLLGFTVHPDIVGRLTDGDSLYAVEAKGNQDILKGIAQAETYQFGFHASFYAIPRQSLSPIVVELTKRKNIGLICVDSTCEILHSPILTNPQKFYSDKVRRQFNAALSVKSSTSFLYNLPTHYLFWLSLMEFGTIYNRGQMQLMHTEFGVSGASFTGGAAGAVRLGLMHKFGASYTLTEMGKSAKMAIDMSLQDWQRLHEEIKEKLLIEASPQIAGVLRMLMIFDDKLNLLINGVKRLSPSSSVEYLDIVKECDKLDHDTSIVYFFKPEYTSTILGSDYLIDWNRVEKAYLRPAVDYQTKSMMYHAGFIRKSPLNNDTWNLINQNC